MRSSEIKNTAIHLFGLLLIIVSGFCVSGILPYG